MKAMPVRSLSFRTHRKICRDTEEVATLFSARLQAIFKKQILLLHLMNLNTRGSEEMHIYVKLLSTFCPMADTRYPLQ